MRKTTLTYMFTNLSPCREILLSMLCPFDISKLVLAIGSDLSPSEKKNHLDVLDDIFEESGVIRLMARLGLTIRIFGADINTLRKRVLQPAEFLARSPVDRPFQVFVLVTDENKDNATLCRDYRSRADIDSEPVDKSFAELCHAFGTSKADEIKMLSHWMLCAPYLAGTMPISIPGWIPVFNSRPHINVRAYIAPFHDRHNCILHMGRTNMQQVFGYNNNSELLYNLQNLSTVCLNFVGFQRIEVDISGKLTMNFLHNVLAATDMNRENRPLKYVVVNTAHPLNTSITLNLEPPLDTVT
ncbi:hypothetical protein EK21DRAFT_95133 [Setomelanomma holmii]|uniref:Uncharacterized protein n=1 Tax=Setomelanomma holmii TaxID=210430 RepID=A0A9P4GWC4_9PLEO|nr:hypothetical protein EK21DRAFT_95133 [Setomelanomma holmii]